MRNFEEKYYSTINHMLRVILSCKTEESLTNACEWAVKLIGIYNEFECFSKNKRKRKHFLIPYFHSKLNLIQNYYRHKINEDIKNLKK